MQLRVEANQTAHVCARRCVMQTMGIDDIDGVLRDCLGTSMLTSAPAASYRFTTTFHTCSRKRMVRIHVLPGSREQTAAHARQRCTGIHIQRQRRVRARVTFLHLRVTRMLQKRHIPAVNPSCIEIAISD